MDTSLTWMKGLGKSFKSLNLEASGMSVCRNSSLLDGGGGRYQSPQHTDRLIGHINLLLH